MESSRDTTGPRAGALDLVLAGGWQIGLFVGVVTFGLGILLLAWPGETLKVLAILVGLQLLLFGLFRLINAFSADNPAPGVMGLIGVVSMLAGIFVIRRPFATAAILATILGLVWIVGGAIDLMSALTDRRLRDRGFTAIAGLLSVVAGVVIVSWPEPTLAVVAIVGGIYLVLVGLVIAATAWRVRSMVEPGA